ncbi:MAG: beta-Ala-His dipeptidase [Candidatus Lokiarchaeota archaeon]|nr:beta-Ala-His dipeptidase [Candidatus Lokiarchaeota archaeon]
MVLEKLKPEIVWNIFEHVIAKTPRPSHHEEMIRTKIKSWLSEQTRKNNLNLTFNEDSVGNLLIRKPATRGMESAPSLMFQAHMDMVCETDRADGFDFMNSGIPIRIQDNLEWVDADGTTLGADNGIGVAFALAVLVDQSIKAHGPLEVLLTVNEEDGFDGAALLDPVALDIQSKLMINLDGGPIEDIVVGSVCGRRIRFSKNFNWKDYKESENLDFYEITVQGLLSGHSGEDIHLPRANANKLISRIASNISQEMKTFVSKWQGGSKSNVIPAKSSIVLGVTSKNKQIFEEMLKEEISLTIKYHEKIEPDLKIEYKKALPKKYLSEEESDLLISTINIIPHGVLKISSIYDKFIESSNNLAIIDTEKETEIIWLYPRSMIRHELNSFCVSMEQLGNIGDWKVFLRPILPEWLPNLESMFLNYVKTEYENLLKKNVKTTVIHGGLETGMINNRVTGLQMVSLGPTIESLHSPSEKLKIADVGVLYTLIKKLIAEILKLKLI